jgi:hypothetical protein
MRRLVALLMVVSWLPLGTIYADCGSIPFKPGVSILEPNQRAVIAYDGKEQILLLSTDLQASEPTKVLEVIPFPSEPKVKEGDQEVFRKVTELIWRKLSASKSGAFGKGGMMGGMGGGGVDSPPAGEVTFHEEIGAHDISVVHVLDRKRFVGWVEDYLKESGVDNPTIPPALERVVVEYLRDGFQWFAFNVVELTEAPLTKGAIQYRFKTPFLYYPLKITRAEEGKTTVRLLIFSPRLVTQPGPQFVKVRLVHEPLKVANDELLDLDRDLHGFFKDWPEVLLRTWEVKGLLSAFKNDVIAR